MIQLPNNVVWDESKIYQYQTQEAIFFCKKILGNFPEELISEESIKKGTKTLKRPLKIKHVDIDNGIQAIHEFKYKNNNIDECYGVVEHIIYIEMI